MKNKKISVIVPIYNVEKYIDKCLDSLYNQTYDNLEILLVDDCSKDNTMEVVNKFLNTHKSDKFILLHNEKNSGLSFSRNNGISHATGEYLGFIDSDDYIPNNYYQSLYESAISNNADVVVCDIKTIYEDTFEQFKTICGGKEKIDFINNGLAASACNKLFRRNVIIDKKFSVGKVNEDLAVVLPILINSKKIVYNDAVCYNYIQHSSSIQNSKITFKRFDIFYGVDLTLDRIKNNKDYEKFKNAIIYNQIFMMFIYIFPKEKNIIRRAKLLKQYYKLSKKYKIRKNYFVWDFLESQGIKHRLYYKALLKLNDNGFSLITSLLIFAYDTLKKIYDLLGINVVIKKKINLNDLIKLSKKQKKLYDNNIKLSVIIPNYNYSKFLYQRLYSILNQKEKIYEIIVLDDKSTDDSIKMIDEIVDKLSKYINITKVYNDVNSGSAFKQWQKGFNLAKGNYVWIAEADDYCDCNFLKNVLNPIKKDNNIVISYSDTAFINKDGKIIYKSIKPEIDIMNTNHWNKNYVNDGIDEFNNYTFLNCTIANVSSAIIKKDNYNNFFELSGNFKQAGDWLFYANIMHLGKVAYYNSTLNYYRVHGNNVSSVTKKMDHFNEIIRIHKYYDENYHLTKKQKKYIEDRYDVLIKSWKLQIKK